jgi:hypothetical protein
MFHSNIRRPNVCRPDVCQTYVCHTNVGQTNVGQATVGQTNVGQTNAGQTNVCQPNVSIKYFSTKCLSTICLSNKCLLTKRHGTEITAEKSFKITFLADVEPENEGDGYFAATFPAIIGDFFENSFGWKKGFKDVLIYLSAKVKQLY